MMALPLSSLSLFPRRAVGRAKMHTKFVLPGLMIASFTIYLFLLHPRSQSIKYDPRQLFGGGHDIPALHRKPPNETSNVASSTSLAPHDLNTFKVSGGDPLMDASNETLGVCPTSSLPDRDLAHHAYFL